MSQLDNEIAGFVSLYTLPSLLDGLTAYLQIHRIYEEELSKLRKMRSIEQTDMDVWLKDLEAYCQEASQAKTRREPVPFTSILSLIKEIRLLTHIAKQYQLECCELQAQLEKGGDS